MSLGRRDAIRLALGAAMGGSSGCQPAEVEEGGRVARATDSNGEPVRDVPIRAMRWADGMVYVDRDEAVDVVAYVSMASRRVYVDRAFRDRASWLLRAHISVSTWHWRIPLPGDDPSVPISPGDHVREFEELDISEWDPTVAPSFDDIRIVRGRPADHRISAPCTTLAGGPEALALRAPITLRAVAPGSDETDREDFQVLGTAVLTGGDCSDAGDAVQLVGWGVRSD